MKRLRICGFILLAFAISAYAEMAGHEGHEMKKGEGQEMQTMCPMMKEKKDMGQMMGPGMMMQDMMELMMDIMNVEERIVTGVKAPEKKEILNKLKDMKTRLQNKMSMHQCMMGGMMGGMMGQQAPQPKESKGKEKEMGEQHEHAH